MGKLNGKVAIVTGGVAGIGLATCKRFLDEGAKVFMVDLDKETLEKQVTEINNGNLACFSADVSSEDQTKAYVNEAIEKFGAIDIYVGNAGILGPALPITDYPTETFEKVLDVNVKGVWLGIKYALPHIRKQQKGSIILISSIAGIKGFPAVTAYSASKHALKGIMRSVAIECAGSEIRVNTVHPGATQTHMIDLLEEGFGGGDRAVGRQALEAGTLINRYASPEEISKLILFLASDDASYSTGSVFMADGGMATK